MVSSKSHILVVSAALSAVTLAGGLAAVELSTRTSIQAAPVAAHVAVVAPPGGVPAASEQEAGDE